jgi:small ligand-binding sensory domain FIST
MPFAAALSTNADTTLAFQEVAKQVEDQLKGKPELTLLFFSPHHSENADELARDGSQRLGAQCLIGCTGETIIGNDQEIEGGPALSLWAGSWAGKARLAPFHLEVSETPEGYTLLGWPDELSAADLASAAVLLLADPFTFPVDAFLKQINEEHKGLPVMGGMASGAMQPGDNVLLLGERAVRHGAVGVLLQGPAQVRTVVSQGCRPIGHHLVITKAQDNVLIELAGKPALLQLQEIVKALPARDQELARRGLHIGRVINEYQAQFQRGDFLVRNVIGADPTTGAIAITERVRVGQTVQFHVRDAATADEDLHALLQSHLRAQERKPEAGLLFSCNGRGTRLFPKPHHDARAIRHEAGPIPLAGFFAQGELGPVGGQNFIHGFTASVVLFEG